jgi:uncharacterized membrane protein YsdA (DUF1294 family)
LILAYLVAINLTAYLSFYLDKSFAKKVKRRIPEKTLLLIALIGGVIGAILAQQQFRHKTHKQPFKGMLYSIPFLYAIILVLFLKDQGRALFHNLFAQLF